MVNVDSQKVRQVLVLSRQDPKGAGAAAVAAAASDAQNEENSEDNEEDLESEGYMEDVANDNLDYYYPIMKEGFLEDAAEMEDSVARESYSVGDAIETAEDSPLVNVDARKVHQVVVAVPSRRDFRWFKSGKPFNLLHVREDRKQRAHQKREQKRREVEEREKREG